MNNIIQKTIQQRRARTNVDSMLEIRVDNGIGFTWKQVAFSTSFNFTQTGNWTLLMLLSKQAGRPSSNTNTLYSALFTKGQAMYADSRYYRRGVYIATRKNDGSYGSYGNPSRPLSNYRFEILLGQGSALYQYAYTDFDFSQDAIYALGITCVVPSDITTYRLFVNSVEQSLTIAHNDALSEVASGAQYNIGYAEFDHGVNALTPYGHNGLVGHVSLFNKILSQEEISYMHRHGGLLADSTHESVQCYFPFTQPNGLSAYNVIEQFNYAKATAIQATHGAMSSYTRDETGADFSSSNKVWKDFYEKEKDFLGYYFWAKALSRTYFPSCPHSADFAFGTSDFEFEVTFTLLSYADFATTHHQFIEKHFDSNNRFIASFNADLLRIHAAIGGRVSAIESTSLVSSFLELGRVYTATYKKVTNDVANWSIWVDGKQIATTIVSNAILSTDSFTFGGDLRFLYSNNTTAGFHIYKHKIKVAGNTVAEWNWNNRSGATVKDIVGTNHITIPSYYPTGAGEKHWRERKSNKVPLVNALRFNKANSQYLSVANFNPTKEQGYTVVVGYAFPIAREINLEDTFCSKLITNAPNPYKLYRGSTLNRTQLVTYKDPVQEVTSYTYDFIASKPKLLIYRENPDNIATLNYHGNKVQETTFASGLLGFDEIAADLHIGADVYNSRYFDGYMFFLGIAKGIITDKQIKELNNNQLYIQPDAAWTNLDWQLIVNFNRIINTNGVYTLEDLSGKGHVITLRNYTATDVANSLTPINNLR